MAAAAVQLGPGVWRIPTTPWDLVNSFAFRDDDGQVTLVDAGIRSAPPRILAGLAQIGSAPQDVTRLILTHAHGDHAGGAERLRTRLGLDGVTAHERDANYLRAGMSPADDSTTTGRIVKRLGGFPAVPVVAELTDGQVVDVGGGLRVIHTPGHTPGHVSLLHESTSLLITGDAIWNVFGARTWPILALCTDVPMQLQTASVLGELDYDTVAFTHGPEIRSGAREAVRAFLSDPKRFRGGLR
jgi:glyoxylase-like metal-dependent hydrolase (beta-lactamase superfamily II)